MERKGLLSITKDEAKKLIKEAIGYYKKNFECIPEQVVRARRGTPLGLNNTSTGVIYSNLVEKSSIIVLSTENDGIDMLRPMHQEFRDALAALFLCNVGLGYCKKENLLPEEYTTAQRFYVIQYMSELLNQDEISSIWEINRLYSPTNDICCRLLLDIIGRKKGYDYSGVNFSNMDLSNVSLYSLLDNHPGLPRENGAFNNTRFSENTFIPIGHNRPVECVSISYDSDRIISGSFDKTLRIWNLESGEWICTLDGHLGSIRSISVSSSGRAISGSDDRTLRLWNIEEGVFIREFKGHGGAVRAVYIGNDGRWAVSGSYDKTVRIWDLNKERSSKIIGKHLYKVTSLSVYESDFLAVSGDAGGCISLLDISKKIQKETIKVGEGRVIGACFLNNGKNVISGTSTGNINLWNIESGQFKHIRKIEHEIKGSFTCLKVSPDEKYIALGTYHWNIYLIDIESGQCRRVFERHTNRISGVAICDNQSRMISSSWDGTVRIWNMLTGDCLYTLGNQKNCLTSTSMSSNGEYVISGFRNGAVSVWSTKDRICKGYYRKDSSSILNVDIDANGKNAISGSWNGIVRILDLETGQSKPLGDIPLYGLGVTYNSAGAVSISGNGQYALIGRRDAKLYLWEKEAGIIYELLKEQPRKMLSVSIDATGEKAVSVDLHGTIYVWSFQERQLKKRIKNDEVPATCVKIDNKGRFIVSGSYKRLICIYDTYIAEGNQCIHQIGRDKQHTGRIKAVAISADGKTVVSGSREKNMCIWDVDSEKRKYPPQKHKGQVVSVSITMDGKSAVSGDTNDDINLWDLGDPDNIYKYTIRPFVDFNLIGVDFRGAIFDTEELKERCRQNGAIVI